MLDLGRTDGQSQHSLFPQSQCLRLRSGKSADCPSQFRACGKAELTPLSVLRFGVQRENYQLVIYRLLKILLLLVKALQVIETEFIISQHKFHCFSV